MNNFPQLDAFARSGEGMMRVSSAGPAAGGAPPGITRITIALETAAAAGPADRAAGSADRAAAASGSSIALDPERFGPDDPLGTISLWYGYSGIGLQKQLADDERIYGLGEKTGFLNKRGRSWMMWNTDEPDQTPSSDPLYQSIPFSIHARGSQYYGIFIDYPGRSIWDVGDEVPERMRIALTTTRVELYYIPGPSLPEVVRGFAQLTGTSFLPPIWSLGFHQSRYSYTSAERVRSVAAEFRQRRIPCDVIHLDIHYMREYRVFTWDPLHFPDPDRMTAELAADGFRIVTIVDPGVKIDPAYPVYREGLQRGVFARDSLGNVYAGRVWPGPAVFPNFFSSDTRTFWAQQHRELLGRGVAGIWNDMNEPSDFSGQLHPRHLFTPPSDVQLPGDAPADDQGTADQTAIAMEQLHNRYGLEMCRATRQAFQQWRPDERPFVLTRAGYAGIQQYAAVWTGDNTAWWEHLAAAIPMLCNMGLSGIPFAGGDVGGFQENTSPELFIRWMQAAAFTPFFRAHTVVGSRDHEPWSFGTRAEAIVRESIELRYRLLPYWYTGMEQASRSGDPVLRPLLYEFPDDPRLYELDDQFMIGSAIMAAPILRPALRDRAVYLPDGLWYNWWSGTPVEGGRSILADAPLERMPLFVRAGSIIPLTQLAQHTSAASTASHELRLFPGKGQPAVGETAAGSFYSDDGSSFGYQSGEYLRWHAEYRDGTLQRWIDHDGCSDCRQPLRVCAPDGTQLAVWDWEDDTITIDF